MSKTRDRVGLAGLAAGLLIIFIRPALSDEPRQVEPSCEARRLLEEMATAYKGLRSYSDQGELKIVFAEVGGKEKKPRSANANAQLSFIRPNKIALTFGTARLICDGENLITVVDSYKRYHVAAAPKAITTAVFKDEWRSCLLGDANGLCLPLLLTLLLGEQPTTTALTLLRDGATIESDRVIDGKTCRCIRLGGEREESRDSLLTNDRDTARLFVDPISKLLISVEVATSLPRVLYSPLPSAPPSDLPPGVEGDFVVGEPVSVLYSERSNWSAGVVLPGLPPESTFKFDPPEGYTRVKTLEDLFEAPVALTAIEGP